jgi:hypothetical protein
MQRERIQGLVVAFVFHLADKKKKPKHKNAKKWFSANCKNILVAPVWYEPEFLEFGRAATNLSDFRILNLFDWLDVRNAGSIEFDEFFLFAALLFAVESGQSTHFLYFHGKRVFALCKKTSLDENLPYHRFARLAYALGMTDDLITGLNHHFLVVFLVLSFCFCVIIFFLIFLFCCGVFISYSHCSHL